MNLSEIPYNTMRLFITGEKRASMRKRSIMLFFVLILLAVSGCSLNKDFPEFETYVPDEGKTAENLENMEIIEYADEEEAADNTYTHMQKIRLREEDYTIDTYIIKADSIKSDEVYEISAESYSDGITMRISLVRKEKDIISSEVETNLDKINGHDGLKEEPKIEIKDNLGIISYSIVENGKEYPCLYICKTDELVDEDEMKVAMLTSIFIDNRKANANTSKIMKEVLDVTGIEKG